MMNIADWSELDKERLFSYLSWNCCRSEQHKLLYIATPKVACTSIKWWFAELEGVAEDMLQNMDSAESDPDLIIHDNFRRVAPNVTGLSSVDLLEPLTSSDYYRFALVRNPYKRIFSAWQSKLLLREPLQVAPYITYDFYNRPIKNSVDIAKAFEGFLEHLAVNEAPNFLDVHWTPQVNLLRPDLINYSKLVKIENAHDLSAALSERLGSNFTDPFETKSANVSLIPYLPELITPRSAELIRSLYARDFSTFGYSDEIPQAKETFSTDEFILAIKAVELIRGRHLMMINTQTKLAQQSMIIDEKTKLVDEQVKLIDDIYRSRSWRATRLLRFLEQWMFNLRNR